MCQCASLLMICTLRWKFIVISRNRSVLTRFYYLDFGNQCANACADFYVGMLMCQCANDLFRKAKKFKVDGRKRSGLTRFYYLDFGNQCANACADFYVGMLMCQCANVLVAPPQRSKAFSVFCRKRTRETMCQFANLLMIRSLCERLIVFR
jgi:hypothetical protein